MSAMMAEAAHEKEEGAAAAAAASDKGKKAVDGEEEEPKRKKAKGQGKKEKEAGGGGPKRFELGGKRFVTVDTFGGKPRVDIREFYLSNKEDEGSLAPGKKGISLTVEQWATLASIASQVNEAVEDL